MVYDFIIKEEKKTTVPVRANNPEEADRIFDEWYDRHQADSKDTTISDLLDNGYEGITVTRCEGKEESLYNPEDIMLPEEESSPCEKKYSLEVTFADRGGQLYAYPSMTLGEIGCKLADLSQVYYLFPNAGADKRLMVEKRNDPVYLEDSFCVRAVPKYDTPMTKKPEANIRCEDCYFYRKYGYCVLRKDVVNGTDDFCSNWIQN